MIFFTFIGVVVTLLLMLLGAWVVVDMVTLP